MNSKENQCLKPFAKVQIRACIFDLDGLLINTPDIHIACHNKVLDRFGARPLNYDLQARIQGLDWEAYNNHFQIRLSDCMPNAQLLPGVQQLLNTLGGPRASLKSRISCILTSTSTEERFRVKTLYLKPLFRIFPLGLRFFRGDPDLRGISKPSPGFYIAAMKRINDNLPAGEESIKAHECLASGHVFEDGVQGLKSALAAGMRVIWVPHVSIAKSLGIDRNSNDPFTDPGDSRWSLLSGVLKALELSLTKRGQKPDGSEHVFRKNIQYLSSLESFPYQAYGF
ncbi:HAD-like domain-containing protein [Bisporella sp. PMI_857]|nr:HAD-like domain-containing protein [Bisporella sp. PMI_857]